jgi:hypothetical protein
MHELPANEARTYTVLRDRGAFASVVQPAVASAVWQSQRASKELIGWVQGH